MRLLLANEPQSYRQVIAGAVRALRPDIDVAFSVLPEDMDSEVLRLLPDMIVCSRLTPVVESSSCAWVLLYPDGETKTVISIGGERTTSADLEFEELLAVIDRVATLRST